ncbi:VF530 family protein [Rouxiella badensis]|uniref:DUF2132 domain-containing protein n=1 Tax=Rouxiella badensis TaxID=1646377 RepID=A0A1X0WLG5_9GAMM|nr:VF530 family protein [Rouxiella badensis]MCC3700970.1 VF530 family protein [Rouxiella badensis]MCC3717397.1 VF530 family protein [Rouxiella badensis]MCC3727659.1 VF530 family protein [Rouxiella badensis]MCC3732397.1 VF530 family protein [Rouxiella badensis]MCC3740491.1 VF530 family protein [Rouxiella badensis]
MTDIKPKDPLHGVTLEKLLTVLVENFGWPALAGQVNINCFKSDPSIKSSLKFLRRTPWARKEVETLYLDFVEGLLKPDMSSKSKRRSTSPASTPAAVKKASSAKPAADSPWNNHPLVKKNQADES